VKVTGQVFAALPAGTLPADRDMPEELHVRADADMAGRSSLSALVYVLLWVLLVALTGDFAEIPLFMGGCGALLAAIGIGRLLLGTRFQIWHGRNPRLWRKGFEWGVAASALVWSLLSTVLVARHGLDGNSMTVLLATAGIAAGGSTSLSPRLRLVRAFLILLLAPRILLILFGLFQEGGIARGVALMILLFLVFLLAAVKRMHDEYWLALYNSWLLDRRANELESARDQAMAASRAKDEFLATMSHELRTPLNAILGFSELLKDGHSGPLTTEQQEYLQHVSGSGQHLLDLINDILDLAKIDAQRLELERLPVAVDDLCRASLDLVRVQAKAGHLELAYIPPPRPLAVQGDARRLRQILVNLLGNAVKFTPEGGRVTLEAAVLLPAPGQSELHLSVVDTGIGISPEDQVRLFQPFVQLDSGITRQYEGSGLGLALSQRMAQLHQGYLEVSSTPGKGSRFTLVLPLNAAAD